MRRFKFLVTGLAVLAMAVAPASAASLYFTGAGATWDQGVTSNWGTTSGGPYNTAAWADGSDAVLQGTGAAVAVSGTINSVNSLSVNSTGYTLNGGTLTLTGAATIGGTQAVTINSAVAGSAGLTKVGANALTINGTSIGYTGATTFGRGTVGSFLKFGVTGAGVAKTLSSVAITEGAGYGMIGTVYGTSGNNSLTISSLAARPAGAVLDFFNTGGLNGSTNKIVVTGQATGLMGTGLLYGTTAPAWYDAAGFVRAANYGVDAGTALISSGTGPIASNNAVRINNGVGPTAQTSATIGSLTLVSVPTFALANGAVVTVEQIIKAGNQYSTISSAAGGAGTLQIANNKELIIATPGTLDNLGITTAITGSGTNNFLKVGAGAVTLYGPNTWTGVTRVTGGTLGLGTGGYATLANTSAIDVYAGATFNVSAVTGYALGASQTLKGNGTIVGALLASGTVAPGDSIGTLSFNGALTLGGIAAMEISKSGSLLTSDLMNVTGTNALAYGGTLTVTELGSVSYVKGDTWNLFDAGSFSGSFGTVNLPTLGAGWSWDITKLAVDGTVSVVPEPSTLALLATGLIGLLAYAWRKRK